MKRLLAAVLAVVLAFGLIIPAMASQTNPNAPAVTWVQRPDGPVDVGDTVVFEVAAQLPAGVQGQLSFAWYIVGMSPIQLPIATEPRLEFSAPRMGGFPLRVVVTNTYINAQGQQRTATTQMDTTVAITLRWYHRLQDIVQHITVGALTVLSLPFQFFVIFWGEVLHWLGLR